MFRNIIKFLKKNYQDIIQSIAFYPMIISLSFLLLALGSLQFENLEVVQAIKKKIPYIFIEEYETARAILSTIIGGIISLTVFSFSMVMVVLNQASSNFSPRLLPSLISNKRHQIILGFYIGTLLYCIIILTALGAYGVNSETLGLSTMFAAVASLVCIIFFVYFINSISIAIQIHNIVDKIFHSTADYLDGELEIQKQNEIVLNTLDSEGWLTINIKETGYYRDFDTSLMLDSLKDKESHIEIIPYINEHIWKGTPVLRIKDSISQEEIDNLLFCFSISSDRHDSDRGLTGMIKLTEIAVKAMSPGINDPGTAINSINKIGQLLDKTLQFPELDSRKIEDKKLIITKHGISAKELMRTLIQPIRLYAKHDNSVVYVLLKSLLFIQNNSNISIKNKTALKIELEALKYDIMNCIDNQYDKGSLIELFNGDN